MGYTDFTINNVQQLLRGVDMVVDLGAQNNYSYKSPVPAPYMREWYEAKNICYISIDLNGEDGARQDDLGVVQGYKGVADLLIDAGTSEHVGYNGAFSWEAIYNCWVNKFALMKDGARIYSENPQTASWPLHGFNYYTTEFYYQLAEHADLGIIDIGVHAACHNTRNGWNVWCSMRKYGTAFPDLDTFKTFDLRQS